MPNRDDVFEIRLANTRQLMEEWGGPRSFAAKLGKSESQISQIAGKNPSRPIGENLAEQIEQKLDLPAGWLSQRHDGPNAAGRSATAVDEDLLTRTVAVVTQKVRDLPKGHPKLPNEKFAALVALVYERARVTGRIDEAYLGRLLVLST